MNPNSKRPFKCRCGRESHRPEIVNGILFCPSCAFDELYGTFKYDQRPPARPPFKVRRIA